MHFSRHDAHAGFFLAAIQHATQSGGQRENNSSLLEDARRVLESLEDNPAPPQAIDDDGHLEEIAGMYKAWSAAVDSGDHAAVETAQKRISVKAGANHPFPFAQVSQFYREQAVPQSDRYQICLQRYRAHAKGSEIIVNKLPNDAKVGVIGDWGTGNEDARLLLDNMMQREPNLAAILHLGDIYDTGSTQEVATKFVAPMKAVLGDASSRIPIFSISGDHEYFSPSDGVGFYGLIDTINAKLDKGWKQNASYFCLRTEDDKWQFLGADTGIESVNLRQNPWLLPEEIAWHQDRIQEFKGKGKTVFLTHHPLIVEMAGPGALNQNLLRSIGGFLQDLDLYLWGHDHWFLAYNNNLAISPGLTLPRGRLLGGSARETDAPRQPANPGWVQMAGGSPIVAGQVNRGVFNHTYAILDLGASTASYYQTPAWHPWDNKTANRTCPQAPLFVESL